LRESGADVLETADPRTAPFEFAVRTLTGDRIQLVCYAFTANEYQQAGRPPDEHRFQIKYGSDFDRYHDIYFDPNGHKVTLMFGVHLEKGLFIAVDPRMHAPTWFSSSVEFKTGDLRSAKKKGWHGWQRERSDARRKQTRPEENLQTETVIGFRPDQFLRYVEFERVASGLDCGERLLLSDRIEKSLAEGEILLPAPGRHPLELQLGLPASEILDVISGAFRLAAAVRGGVAEHHLDRYLREVPGVRHVRHIIEDGKPDFEVEYRRKPFLIECKNVLARPQKGLPKVDFQKTRASKADPCSRYYKPAQFQVLAACLHPITKQWEFRFTPTETLEPHPRCIGRLASNVLVKRDWPENLRVVLDQLYAS
ncbi:MAG: hypothetical protein ACRD3J_17715, partial [Thermoanaerobaculia bacterium]